MTPDGLATGETGDGLIYHCLKYGGGKILPGGSLIYKGLDIGLCKDSAACSYRVDLLVAFCIFIKTRGIRLYQRCHLVDK